VDLPPVNKQFALIGPMAAMDGRVNAGPTAHMRALTPTSTPSNIHPTSGVKISQHNLATFFPKEVINEKAVGYGHYNTIARSFIVWEVQRGGPNGCRSTVYRNEFIQVRWDRNWAVFGTAVREF
jgi:hypothetical protein